MKKLSSFICSVLFLNSVISCAHAEKIGISFPTSSVERWSYDGSYIKAKLEELGHEVELKYAYDSDIPTQLNQLGQLIDDGCTYLLVTPVDCGLYSQFFQRTLQKDICLISYERLIMNSDAVSYFVTFNHHKIGQMQAEYIIDKLSLNAPDSPAANIEIFVGDTSDLNSDFNYDNAMELLNPLIKAKKIFVRSNEYRKKDVQLPDTSPAEAKKRMRRLISANHYGPKGAKLDAVLVSNDILAQGVIEALAEAGYDKSNMPIVTGQGCEKRAVARIANGMQSMSLFTDNSEMAKLTVKLIKDLIDGSIPAVNDRTTYDNGRTYVPAVVINPTLVTSANYKNVLIDSDYYNKAEISRLVESQKDIFRKEPKKSAEKEGAQTKKKYKFL